jgi:HSP20 family molecular chaperone IbpA
LINDFGKGFWVKPFAFPAEYKDGVLNLTLPKKSNGSAKRVAVT